MLQHVSPATSKITHIVPTPFLIFVCDLDESMRTLCEIHMCLSSRRAMVVWRWNMSGADGSLINLSRFAFDDDNLNLTLDDESNSLEKKNYWALLLLLLCVAVVFGNVLVILSVVKVSPFSSSSPRWTLWSGASASKRDKSLHRILGSGRPLCRRSCHAFLCLHNGGYIIYTGKTALIVM